MRIAVDAKNDDVREARAELRDLKSERCSASKSNKALENQVTRLLKQVDHLKGQLAAKDTALRQVSNQLSSQEKGQRAAEGDLNARSARLNRALEEVQRYRKLLEEFKVRFCMHPDVTAHGTPGLCNCSLLQRAYIYIYICM